MVNDVCSCDCISLLQPFPFIPKSTSKSWKHPKKKHLKSCRSGNQQPAAGKTSAADAGLQAWMLLALRIFMRFQILSSSALNEAPRWGPKKSWERHRFYKALFVVWCSKGIDFFWRIHVEMSSFYGVCNGATSDARGVEVWEGQLPSCHPKLTIESFYHFTKHMICSVETCMKNNCS